MRPLLFADQVRDVLRNSDGRGGLLESPTTPAVLRMLGFPAAPLAMSTGVLFKIATGKNGERPALSEYQICRLPELIDDPVLVATHVQNISMVVLTNCCDGDQKPIVCAVRPNVTDGVRVVNMITTAFGKDKAEDWLADHVAANRVMYVGEKTNPRLPLPDLIYYQMGAHGSEGSQLRILRPDDLIKYRKEASAAILGVASVG